MCISFKSSNNFKIEVLFMDPQSTVKSLNKFAIFVSHCGVCFFKDLTESIIVPHVEHRTYLQLYVL